MVSSDALLIATLIMSLISMVLSCMALWPQCKDGLMVVRDSVLWVALVAIVVGGLTVGWRYYRAGMFLEKPSRGEPVGSGPIRIDAGWSDSPGSGLDDVPAEALVER